MVALRLGTGNPGAAGRQYGFTAEQIARVKEVYKILYRQGLGLEEAKAEVTQDELRNSARAQMMQYMNVQALDETPPWLDSYVDRMMQDEKFVERTYHELLAQKVFDYANTKVGKFDEKEVSHEDFQKTRHHHQH